MQSSPLISVITPCYNAEMFLAETLDSVIAQTYSNWECIIVNDGSIDKSGEVALEYVKKDRRFKYIYQQNQGPSVARNNAISISKGEYILPLDADDIIEPTYMEKAMHYFNEHPDTKIVYCRTLLFGEQSGEWQIPLYDYDKFIHQNCLIATSFFRRKDFDEVGGYNPMMRGGLEDWELWLEMIRPYDKVYRIDEILFHYRIRKTSRNINASGNGERLKQQMRARNSLEYQFGLERFALRKYILSWPFKLFSLQMKAKYKKYCKQSWKIYRNHDFKACLIYPYMVVYRRIIKYINKMKQKC